MHNKPHMGTLEYTDQLFKDKFKYLNKIYNEYKLIKKSDIKIKGVNHVDGKDQPFLYLKFKGMCFP